MDKLKEVKKIIQMMNEGSVTTQDLQTFITATLEFVKKHDGEASSNTDNASPGSYFGGITVAVPFNKSSPA